MTEGIIYYQTNTILSEKNIFYNFQSGFRQNYSLSLPLSDLTDKVLKGFNEGLITGMILINIQKAFETINHEVLLQNLQAIKFSEQSIQRFRSYFCDRIYLLETGNKLSDFGNIFCRPPQGSALGPLLFIPVIRLKHLKSYLLL